MMPPSIHALRAACCVVVALAVSAFAACQPRDSGATGRRLAVLFVGAPTQNGPHHDPITRYRVLKQGLGTAGIDLTYSEDPAHAWSKDTLAQFDAVLMYGNWRRHGRMPKEQFAALLGFVEGGGGFLPIHCASACYGRTPGFVRLVGGRFKSHGGGEFTVQNQKPNHAILRGIDGFRAWDETYVHDAHGEDREILQTRDGEPWTWTRRQGKGRVFYTAAGHDHRVWNLPAFQGLLRNAIYWAVGAKKQQLDQLQLPELRMEKVSLPGYRRRREVIAAQAPLAPRESMKLAQVPAGMELSLFASEPNIVNPISVAWDHRGRAFVIETVDYPNNLQKGNIGNDRITICEDRDGDGQAEVFTRFCEKLSIPTSLCFARGGVICTNGSEMLFLRDTDGDDRADVRKVLFSGFRMGDTHAGPSNLRYGADGWIYATIGYSGFDGVVGGKRHRFAQGVFRFLPDGSKLEFLQTTTNNTWGLGLTEEFDVVGSTANANPSFYLTFPRRDYEAAGLQQGRTPRADSNPVFFPASMDIRQVDQFDRYTSAAGHSVYTARRFPSPYHNSVAFVCGPTGKLVGRFDLQRHGAGFRAVQSPNNLFCSADAWTSPVCAEVGPDGAVWILDWYNIVVQHNPTPSKRSSGIDAKRGKGNAYVTPHRDKQHGRIYRVYPRGSANDSAPSLDPSRPETLVAGLEHSNLMWRLHAQRLIVEGGAGQVSTELKAKLEGVVRKNSRGAAHALRALAQLGSVADLVAAALRSSRPALRRAAIALANPQDLKSAFVQDGTIPVRGRELAEVLVGLSRAASDPEIGAAVYRVAADLGRALFEESALRDAWTIAARRQRAGVLAAAKAAGGLAAQQAKPKNLLSNPGFEKVADGVPVGWSDVRYYGGARGESVRVRASDGGRGGGKCLKVSSAKPSDCGVAMRVPLRGGYRYRLSGFVKTEGIRPVRGPGAMMNVHGGRMTRGVRGTKDWTEVAVEFEAGGNYEAIVHCLFGGYGGATGVAYWDDVSLIEIANGTTLAGAITALASSSSGDASATAKKVRKHAIDAAVHARGLAVFQRTCVACHGVDGRGVPRAFPPLDGADWLTGDPSVPIRIVLHGLFGKVTVKGEEFTSAMAPLGPALSDQEVADVLTFVRQSWTNDATPVTRAAVAAQRKAHAARKQMWTAKELGR